MIEHIDDGGEEVIWPVRGAEVVHLRVGGLTLCGVDAYNMEHAQDGEARACKRCEKSAAV